MKTVKEVIEDFTAKADQIIKDYPEIMSLWMESEDHDIDDLHEFSSNSGKEVDWSDAKCRPFIQYSYYPASKHSFTFWVYGKESVRTFDITEI